MEEEYPLDTQEDIIDECQPQLKNISQDLSDAIPTTSSSNNAFMVEEDETIELLQDHIFWTEKHKGPVQSGEGENKRNPVKKTVTELIHLDVRDKKKYALGLVIQRDPKATDLKWSLFCAACHSFRYDSILKPFPKIYQKENGDRDIDELRKVTVGTPAFPLLFDDLKRPNPLFLNKKVVDLLYWVLIHLREPKLRYVKKSEHETVLAKVRSSNRAAAPQHILAVKYDVNGPSETRFKSLAQSYSTQFGFHGSKVENFYSILNHGLQLALNKEAAFGPGIYLSSELSVSLQYSRAGFTWGASYFGGKISVVALCEMINHPNVKYHDETGENRGRSYAAGSENGPVPRKYFIVQNSELIRVRYLLVYTSSTQPQHLSSSLCTWFSKNKMLSAVVGYILMLVAVGLSRSPIINRYYKQLVRQFYFQVMPHFR